MYQNGLKLAGVVSCVVFDTGRISYRQNTKKTIHDLNVLYKTLPDEGIDRQTRVFPCSIILSTCGADGREGLADVISIHNRLTTFQNWQAISA